MSTVDGLILALIITLALHLVEEINTGLRHRFPFGTMPKPIFIGINIVIYTFSFITLFLSLFDNDLALPFVWIFAVGVLLNGVGHIGIMAVRRHYFPGGLTAFLLVLVAFYLIMHLLNI